MATYEEAKEVIVDIDKRAKELMEEHPNGITVEQLVLAVPDENQRQLVLGRMMFLALDGENTNFGLKG